MCNMRTEEIPMDSISHTRVGTFLLDHVEAETGVTFDTKAFLYGNLKPDLTGTYLTKRHYPSLMFEEVMDKIRSFSERYEISADAINDDRSLAVDLGEICHYITDFFCFPHNDDIYDHCLLRHYIYEKRIAAGLRRRLTWEKFETWVSEAPQIWTVEDLIDYLKAEHETYRAKAHHCIADDLEHICRVTVSVVIALIHACGARLSQPAMA